MANDHKLIGKDFTVPDIEAKVTGRAKYSEDFRADNIAFCKTLTSPIPHAKIRSIDTSAALKMPMRSCSRMRSGCLLHRSRPKAVRRPRRPGAAG